MFEGGLKWLRDGVGEGGSAQYSSVDLEFEICNLKLEIQQEGERGKLGVEGGGGLGGGRQ